MTCERFPGCAEPSSAAMSWAAPGGKPADPGSEPNPEPRVKPRFRGMSHLLAACIATPAAVFLWFGATSWAARWGAAIYGLSLVLLLATSAVYHRPTWGLRARDLLGRLDQSAIFLLIAGTYTPPQATPTFWFRSTNGSFRGPRGRVPLIVECRVQ